MKTLYLHIGSHKTGTSSIQRILKERADLLKFYDLYFLSEHPNGMRSSGNSALWFKTDDFEVIHNNLFLNKCPGVCESKLKLLSAKLNQLNSNVVISSEYLSWLFSSGSINKIKKHIGSCFDNIKIIIYVRRQDKLVVSHHQQSSKISGGLSSAFYGSSSNAIPQKDEGFRNLLDFNNRISKWESIFGKENIIVRSHDKSFLIGGDVVKDFFNILGVDINESIQFNKSGMLENIKVGYLLNASLVGSELSNRIRNSITGTQKSLPSRSQAKEFYEQYRESNILLNNRYSISDSYDDIFSSDFSFYPKLAEDVWTEETANKVIFEILSAVQPYAQLTKSDLHKASKLIYELDETLSEKLLIASKKFK